MAFRLVCFDLDGTLIENITFIWQTLHERLGTDVDERVQAKESFFAGKLSYHDWAVHDVGLWVRKGVTRDDVLQALSHLRLVSGARKTLEALRERGIKLAIISGSLDVALESVLPDYQEIFDAVYINRLVFDGDNRLIGITPTKYDFKHKATALKQLAGREGIPLAETVFIGDHQNDVEAARMAGFSIAFNCRSDELRQTCDQVIEGKDISVILKSFG
ncbi:MAG: HAD-IB family phosphatase [DPANN group archaeon]|nr:HAD-IB family phosphatase [DPANN group archaeon]